MPALLLAIGSGLSWVVSALLAGLAGAAFQKALKIGAAAFLLPIVMGWIAEKFVGMNPFDAGQLLGGFLGGLPALFAYTLDAMGFVAFIFVIVKADVAVMVIRLLMRVMGMGR